MKYYVIDANVMLTAGKRISDIPNDQLNCWKGCVEFIHEIVKSNHKVVVDRNWEILKEYHNCKQINGYPNNADDFYKYVLTEQERHLEYVELKKAGQYDYYPYPEDDVLISFDPPDRKYIAVSFNHRNKPPIVEATDSKWYGIIDNLKRAGIDLIIIDEKYLGKKYEQKMN